MDPITTLKFLRVHHWVKNLLVFVPLTLSFQLFNSDCSLSAVCGFAIFCLASSIVYIINDLRDLEADKLHPTKRLRPLPSGKMPLWLAWFLLGFMLLTLCVMFAFLGIKQSLAGAALYFAIPVAYIVLNIAYSAGLKNVPLLDVSILMAGYVMRIIYGGVVTGLGVSNWVLLTAMSFSFFMGFGKRRNELKKYGADGRKMLERYTIAFLDKGLQLSMAMGVIFYALACGDSNTVVAKRNINLIWSVPLVFVLFLRYLMLLESGSDGDPVYVVFSDKWILMLAGAYVALTLLLLYPPL